MDVYMLDTPQEEILQCRPIKFDFTNEFKEGRPILRVQKLALKPHNFKTKGFLSIDWDVSVESMLESIDTYTGGYDHEKKCDLRGMQRLLTLQTMIIKDLQEKVNALTPQEQKPNMKDSDPRMGVPTPVEEKSVTPCEASALRTFPSEKSDPFEEEVQRRLAKELYEQRVNAEVQRRLTATKTDDGINKVFAEWKEIPIFKDIASLLKP